MSLKLVFICPLTNSLYTYDMRYLERPVTVHMDHVSAVLDVDYSPTGKEFVSASFDKTIRIFPHDGGRSRSVTLGSNIIEVPPSFIMMVPIWSKDVLESVIYLADISRFTLCRKVLKCNIFLSSLLFVQLNNQVVL